MDPDLELTGFEGVCRLFPLPDVVLFPHCVLPLHIFEPRYRQMTEDALAGDKLISMVRIRDEADWNMMEDPPIDRVACLGKIFDHQRLADGRYNLLLVGLKRVELVEELPRETLYRSAKVSILEDRYPVRPIDGLRDRLTHLFRELCLREGRVEPEIARLLDTPIPMGVLTDLLGHYLGLPPDFKRDFLAEARVEERANSLVGVLERHLDALRKGAEHGDFPPPFSTN
ncbi:LON peptidase substrate-binding domain-containing protein [Tautonia plasticadhaerens]|uniref:Lon protease n=1 Tax=Tautonia plasticadhaerens TaxID=2527974 RepID=A0A518GY66_9BACT|nr:LON peptidase substrate-binding domain-containing protein [Tautonia plasticadhaerens]QDV33544.1 Lon protease [Tautonia plasticadhaerens]